MMVTTSKHGDEINKIVVIQQNLSDLFGIKSKDYTKHKM